MLAGCYCNPGEKRAKGAAWRGGFEKNREKVNWAKCADWWEVKSWKEGLVKANSPTSVRFLGAGSTPARARNSGERSSSGVTRSGWDVLPLRHPWDTRMEQCSGYLRALQHCCLEAPLPPARPALSPNQPLPSPNFHYHLSHQPVGSPGAHSGFPRPEVPRPLCAAVIFLHIWPALWCNGTFPLRFPLPDMGILPPCDTTRPHLTKCDSTFGK